MCARVARARGAKFRRDPRSGDIYPLTERDRAVVIAALADCVAAFPEFYAGLAEPLARLGIVVRSGA